MKLLLLILLTVLFVCLAFLITRVFCFLNANTLTLLIFVMYVVNSFSFQIRTYVMIKKETGDKI